MDRRDFTPTILYMLGGLVIWAVRFLAGYSFTALACARGWDGGNVAGYGLVALVGLASAVMAVVGCLVILLYATARLRAGGGQEMTRFKHAVAALVAGLSIVAIAWEMIPFAVLPVCT